MVLLATQQFNIIICAFLLLFSIYVINIVDRNSKISKLYIVMLFIGILMTALEAVKSSITGIWISSIGLIMLPVLTYLYLKFIQNYFPHSKSFQTLCCKVIIGLLGINLVQVIALGYYPQSLNISMVLSVIISLIPIFYGVLFLKRHKKMLCLGEYYYMICVLVVQGGIIAAQAMLLITQFLWSISSIVIIFMFIVLQQRELFRDTLTGARNRRALHKSIKSYIKRKKHFSLIMIDLDLFKSINDTYGHAEGNYVLRVFVVLLQKVFNNTGVVVRIGGDEFSVLVDEMSSDRLESLIGKMVDVVDKFNRKRIKPYTIKFSYAYGTYSDNTLSIEDFINEIDLKMYKNKKDRKTGKVKRIDL